MENTAKKKILYVITQSEWGGAQRYLFDLITSPEASRCDIEVIMGVSPDSALAEKLAGRGIVIHQAKNLVREPFPLNDMAAIFELKNLFTTINPSVIHLNSSKAGVIGSLAFFLWPEKNKSQLIYTVHGWVLNEPINPLLWSFYYLTERITAQIKNKIICVSEFDRQTALKHHICPEDKLITIHNGISEQQFLTKDQAKEELFRGITFPDIQNKIIVGTIGNFYKTKGLEYFIGAISLLAQNNIPVMGVIIGDGRLRPQLENIIKNYDVASNIIILGRKSDPEKYLKAYDIYVCSSVKEGLPYSIMEAMSAGLPIVTTNVGGIPELIKDGENGLSIKPKSPEKLAAGIKFMIDSPDRAQAFGEQAKIDVTNNFSLDEMIQKTFAIYQK